MSRVCECERGFEYGLSVFKPRKSRRFRGKLGGIGFLEEFCRFSVGLWVVKGSVMHPATEVNCDLIMDQILGQ